MKLTDMPEVQNYGQELYKQGWRDGYLKATFTRRRLKLLKEQSLYRQFGAWYDWCDDLIAKNKRK